MMNPSVCLTPLIVTPGPAHGVKSLIPPSVISTVAARLGPLMVILVMIPFAQMGAGMDIAETTRTSAPAGFITAPLFLGYNTVRTVLAGRYLCILIFGSGTWRAGSNRPKEKIA